MSRSPSGSVASRVAAERSKLGAAQLDDIEAPLRDALHDAFSNAFVAGFRTVMLACAALAVLGGVAGWLMVRNGERASVNLDDATEEQDRAGRVVANEEDERMVERHDDRIAVLAAVPAEMTAVAAAASVPDSSTETNAWWTTSETWSRSVAVMPRDRPLRRRTRRSCRGPGAPSSG